VRRGIQSAARATRDLSLLTGLLARLEGEPAHSERLAELHEALKSEGLPPSRRIAQLRRIVDLLEARRNQFFAPFGAVFMWGTHFGLAVENWRAHHGPALSRWVDAAAQMEALGSLASYAFEHPNDPFPEIVEDAAVFDGTGLGHPLLPEADCVRNSVELGGVRQAYMVSGSNMSGKSTLLRTVGVNVVLALAGAPVRAQSLRLSSLAIGASMQVIDSLQHGTSHFYAEITRIRQVMDLTDGSHPVLFLLDEVLHGTNSHDRRIGAEAVLRSLLDRGAIGLITTHDLALARVADELSPKVENVHFQDQLEDGKMHFDYRLWPGVVTRSNALELMRAVGLEV
jgi:DNA mismatch repair ATPase MutS